MYIWYQGGGNVCHNVECFFRENKLHIYAYNELFFKLTFMKKRPHLHWTYNYFYLCVTIQIAVWCRLVDFLLKLWKDSLDTWKTTTHRNPGPGLGQIQKCGAKSMNMPLSLSLHDIFLPNVSFMPPYQLYMQYL